MKNLTIKTLFRVLTIVVALVILLQASMTLRQTTLVETEIGQMVNKSLPALETGRELQMHIIQVQQWLTDISATRGLDGLNDGFDEADKHALEFRSKIAQLIELDPENADQYRDITQAFEAYYRQGKIMAQAYVDRGPIGGNALMEDFDNAAGVLQDRFNPVLKNINMVVDQQQAFLEQQAVQNRQLVLGFSLVYGLGLVLLFFGIRNVIVKPLCQTVSMFEDLAEGEGDLTKRLPEKFIGELGKLARSINIFISKVQQEIKLVGQTVENLAVTSGQLKASTASTEEVMSRQQAETDQVATAIDEMSATINEVASNAVTAADSATQADEQSQNGSRVVQETMTGINMLAEEIERAAEVIASVESHTGTISQVSNVISDIAEQTNLLALNAAIEAARAGEQGRGFAVVADEVRALAKRTQDSTTEIQSTIEQLQNSAKQAVTAMENSQEKTQSTVQQAHAAGDALQVITSEVSNISNMNTQIASAAEEQGAVSEEINRSVVNIRHVSDQTVVEMNSLTQAGDNLQSVVIELKTLLAKFKY